MAHFLRRHRVGVAACVAALATSSAVGVDESALAADDECQALAPGAEREECAVSALQRRGLKVTAARSLDDEASNAAEGAKCASLDAPENAECKSVVEWAATGGGKWDTHAPSWFEDMQTIAGVNYKQASRDDFQRLYYCSPPGGKACGAPPCQCSKPPCGTCLAGGQKARAGCLPGSLSIHCKPPMTAMQYKGMAWPTMKFEGMKEMHIFCIGDWGGMDGSLNPIENRPPIVAYSWGKRPGAPTKQVWLECLLHARRSRRKRESPQSSRTRSPRPSWTSRSTMRSSALS